MEIKYIDSERKTSFIAEGREIDEVNTSLKQFNLDYRRKITLSDILRYWIQKFNDDLIFRETTLDAFKPIGDKVDDKMDNVLGQES